MPIRVIDAAGVASDSLMLRWKAPELNSNSDRAARAGGGTHLTISGSHFGRGVHLTVTGSGFFSAPTILDRDESTLVVEADALPPGAYEMGVTDDSALPPRDAHHTSAAHGLVGDLDGRRLPASCRSPSAGSTSGPRARRSSGASGSWARTARSR